MFLGVVGFLMVVIIVVRISVSWRKSIRGMRLPLKRGGYYLGSGSARWSSLLSKPLLR